MYDPTEGEEGLLTPLEDALRGAHPGGGGAAATAFAPLVPRAPPSPAEVMEAAFRRAAERRDRVAAQQQREGGDAGDLVRFFEDKLREELSARLEGEGGGAASSDGDGSPPLLHELACAMAALSGLERPAPLRSLLTADPAERTLRVYRMPSPSSDADGADAADDADGAGGGPSATGARGAATCAAGVSPAEVTRFCKSLGSGKLNRVLVLPDGSAVFDLTSAKAARLVTSFEERAREESGRGMAGGVPDESEQSSWFVELPLGLPSSE